MPRGKWQPFAVVGEMCVGIGISVPDKEFEISVNQAQVRFHATRVDIATGVLKRKFSALRVDQHKGPVQPSVKEQMIKADIYGADIRAIIDIPVTADRPFIFGAIDIDRQQVLKLNSF